MGNNPVAKQRYVAFSLVLESANGVRAQRQQDDTQIYEIHVQEADEKSVGAFPVVPATGPGSGGSGFKYYPADKKPLPAKGDCFVQLWEIDDWDDQGNSRRFDQYYPYEDRDAKGDRGKNRLVGTLEGVLTLTKPRTWKFVCLDDSALPEVKSSPESRVLLRLTKPSGAGEPKKVAVGVENESRWELGVYATTNQSEKKWETTPFTYPICFVESLRNLIRMQIAEGGIAIACNSDLNVGRTAETAWKTYNAELKKLQAQIVAAKKNVKGTVEAAVKAAAKASTKLPAVTQQQAAAFEAEQTTAMEQRGDQLLNKVKGNVDKKGDTYDSWRNHAAAAIQDAATAATRAFLEKLKARYELTPAAVTELSDAGAADFYDEVSPPVALEDASKKTFGNIKNDREFDDEAERIAQEFGFITVKNGVVTKGSQAVQNPEAWVAHIASVIAAVQSTFPEICPAGGLRAYRIAILTHGATNSGLKFVDPASPEVDHWFGREDLETDRGRKFVGDLAACLAPSPVIALYACNAAGNGDLKARERPILRKLNQDDAKSLAKDLAKLPRKAPNLKQQQQQVRAQHAQKLKQAIDDEKFPKGTYQERLVSYGGDPTSSLSIKNTLGDGSFAKALHDKLLKLNIKADVWGHTDAGHTSRNARLRLLASDGNAYDLVRLVFGDTADFKEKKEPSQKQLAWWWVRGDETLPWERQHAVKKAALCAVASLNDDQRAFSLKTLIANFNGWYS